MKTMIKHSGKAKSIPAGMAIAVSVSMLVTFGGSAVLAGALHAEKVTWEQAGYWIMGMLFLSAFLGAKCAFAVIKRQRGAVSMMLGVLYWGILLCLTALFFGGRFGAVWETAGVIAAGCGTSALIFRSNNKRIGGKRGNRYC